MTWKKVLKEDKPIFNMDENNHIDILLDLRKVLRDEITKAERKFEQFIDDINDNNNKSGSGTNMKHLGNIVNVGVKAFDKIINDSESSINEAMTSINEEIKKTYNMVSPSTEGEIEHEENTDRQQDAYREQMAERHYPQEYEPDGYYD